MTELSIVILNWNQIEATRESLRRCASFEALRPVIWVVDNGSEDGRAEALEHESPGVRLLRSERNLGYGGGNNLALRRIESGYVLLLNNDAGLGVVDLERLVRVLDRDQGVAAAGPLVVERERTGKVLSAGGRDISRHARTHLQPSDLQPGRLERDEPFAVDYVPGSVALLRVETLRQTGFLEESYFFGGELADFCRQAHGLGLAAMVQPLARAWHDTDQSSEMREALYPYYILRNRFLFIRRFRRRSLVPLFVFWSAWGLAAAARARTRGDRQRARLLMLSLADGLTGRFGGQNARVLGR